MMARLLGLMPVLLVALIAANVVSCRSDVSKFLNDMMNERHEKEKTGNDEVGTLLETPTKSGRGECTEPSDARTKMKCHEMDRKVWVFLKNKNQCVAIYVDCNVFNGDLYEKESECIRSCILG